MNTKMLKCLDIHADVLADIRFPGFIDVQNFEM